ncbi:hypothetical protein EfmAA610_00210 [Enterococcus faecium]|nr:hypothetical protein EfmAA610_00210 [Enterococcus faecium]
MMKNLKSKNHDLCNLTHKTSVILPEEKDLLAALPYLEKAKKPVLYVGQGTRNGFPQIKEFSEMSKILRHQLLSKSNDLDPNK